MVGNKDSLRQVDDRHLRVTYHHNYWKNEATRGPAGRFGHQHIFNNLYEDFLYQAIHSRSDNQVLVEANVFRGKCSEALSTYGLVIPMDSPNTSPEGDKEIDGFANLGAGMYKSYTKITDPNRAGKLTSNRKRFWGLQSQHHEERRLHECPLPILSHSIGRS